MRMWPRFLLLIHILEDLIINEKVYNYWNMDPSFYSSIKMLHGFIKGDYLCECTEITTRNTVTWDLV